MLWATSPACTELETQVLDWLVPLGASGEISFHQNWRRGDSGHGVQRDFVRGAGGARTGDEFPAMRRMPWKAGGLYVSSRALVDRESGEIAGIGSENLRLIEVDEHFAMKPEVLARR